MLVFLAAAASEPSLINSLGETAHVLGLDWPKLFGQLIGFGALIWVMHKFAYQRVLVLLEERQNTIRESLDNAEQIKRKLAETEAERRKTLSEANERAAAIIAEAQKAGQAALDKKVQEAAAMAENILRKAEEARKLEHDKMLAELKKEVARLVVETSAKVTGKVLTMEDHKRLNEETIKELAA